MHQSDFNKLMDFLAHISAQIDELTKRLVTHVRETPREAHTEIQNPWAWSSGPVEDKRTSEPLIDRGRRYSTDWTSPTTNGIKDLAS